MFQVNVFEFVVFECPFVSKRVEHDLSRIVGGYLDDAILVERLAVDTVNVGLAKGEPVGFHNLKLSGVWSSLQLREPQPFHRFATRRPGQKFILVDGHF